MARMATTRSILFSPCSRIADFLGTGYTTHGVAETSLERLLPIHPSTSLQALAQLQRKSSTRNQRAGDSASIPHGCAFSVVLFKKINKNLPLGLQVDQVADFFAALFVFENADARTIFVVPQFLS